MSLGTCGPLLCQPFLNALVLLYETAAFRDLGIAIILMTALIRLLLLPVFAKSMRHQMIAQKLQPELVKIKEKHKNDPQEQMRATLALHREHGVNPMTGFGLLALTLVILFPLYRAFVHITDPAPYLYSFIPDPETLRVSFLGLINLGEPSRILTGLVAFTTYLQSYVSLKGLTKKDGPPTPQERIGRQMVYLAPILIAAVIWSLPAAIGLYILTSTVFSVVQQLYVNRRYAHGSLTQAESKK